MIQWNAQQRRNVRRAIRKARAAADPKAFRRELMGSWVPEPSRLVIDGASQLDPVTGHRYDINDERARDGGDYH